MTELAITYDPLRLANELREQLASGKRRIGFLFGAGTSMTSGLPDLKTLTADVGLALSDEFRLQFNAIRTSLGDASTLEDILNRIRAMHEILDGVNTFSDLNKNQVKKLDAAICKVVYERLHSIALPVSAAHHGLAHWIQHCHPEEAVEVFTTNYDLLFETSFEMVGLPYFDGFVGAVQPFFLPQAVDPPSDLDSMISVPPKSWARIWKLHGSVGWRIAIDAVTGGRRIIRVSDTKPNEGEEVVIYPTRDKYVDSRRFPYLTYMDRLRRFLSTGERSLIVCGFSFGDEHIEEILRNALLCNNRLAITALFFADPPDHVKKTR